MILKDFKGNLHARSSGVEWPNILNLKRTFERYLFKLLRSTFNIKRMRSRVRVQPPLANSVKHYLYKTHK